MPYSPGISYRGDQWIAQAGQNVAGDVSDAFKTLREQQAKASYNDAIVQHAASTGRIPADEVAKYNDMSGNAKTNFAAGLAANIVQDWQRQIGQSAINNQQSEIALRGLQGQNIQAQLNETGPYAPFTPSDQWVGGTHLIQTRPDQFTVDPTQGDGANADAPQPLKIDGKIIPDWVWVPKTGATFRLPGATAVERDPTTGALGTRGSRGEFKAFNQSQIQAMQMDPTNPANAPSPTPTPSGGFLPSWLTGGGSAATPSPSPMVSPTPAAQPSPDPAPVTAPINTPQTISTKEQYDALPSGAVYTAPDGSIHRKK